MLEIGKALNQAMPSDVRILFIGTRDVNNFGEYLSPEVEAAIPQAIRMIITQINEMIRGQVSGSKIVIVEKR